MTAKPISIKGTGCRSGGCARKVVGLTPGDLPFVLETGLGIERSMPSERQKSAEGIVAAEEKEAAGGPNGGRQVGGVTRGAAQCVLRIAWDSEADCSEGLTPRTAVY
jgi:hypothetical protein